MKDRLCCSTGGLKDRERQRTVQSTLGNSNYKRFVTICPSIFVNPHVIPFIHLIWRIIHAYFIEFKECITCEVCKFRLTDSLAKDGLAKNNFRQNGNKKYINVYIKVDGEIKVIFGETEKLLTKLHLAKNNFRIYSYPVTQIIIKVNNLIMNKINNVW